MSDLARLRTDDAAWDAFVGGSVTPFHVQVSAWATAKRPNGWQAVRVVADGGSGPIGAQILVRRLGPGPFAMGYAPRGPVATSWDDASIRAFTESLRRTARRHRLTHVTIDPGTEDPAAATLLRDAGWKDAETVQPGRSRVLDLTVGEPALWDGLRSKWRQYVGKAKRADVAIVEGERDDLPAFFTILAETAVRTGFFHRTLASYEAVWDAFRPSGAATLLFARQPDGTPVASLFLVRAGDRVCEPYGGMTDAGAESRANYLLKWEAIRRSAAEGAHTYDMWGLAHPGIEQFKAGFGGYEARYPGGFDLVTLPILRDVVVHGRRMWMQAAKRRLGRQAADLEAATTAKASNEGAG